MTDMSARKKPRVLLSWSSGKDSAWALYMLQQNPDVEVVGLLTTYNQEFERSAIHGVRLDLVRAQAAAAELPLLEVALPWPCDNEKYERIMAGAIDRARKELSPDAVAFGDLYLEDIRRYRETQMAGSGLELIFPVWGIPTDQLSQQMLQGGLKAFVTCIDPERMPAGLSGSLYGTAFLEALPAEVDPCGENGEFHTFVCAGPMFRHDIDVIVGETVERDGAVYTDLLVADQ